LLDAANFTTNEKINLSNGISPQPIVRLIGAADASQGEGRRELE
jgi:hypothetical protein